MTSQSWQDDCLPAGVALGYSQLTDNDITSLPIPRLQTAGFLFVWVINAKYKFTLDLFERWGYTCALVNPCRNSIHILRPSLRLSCSATLMQLNPDAAYGLDHAWSSAGATRAAS